MASIGANPGGMIAAAHGGFIRRAQRILRNAARPSSTAWPEAIHALIPGFEWRVLEESSLPVRVDKPERLAGASSTSSMPGNDASLNDRTFATD